MYEKDVMLNGIAKLMLVLCLWNVAGEALPRAMADLAPDTVASAEMASVDPCSDEGQDTDCDPSDCENEACRFHQCHVGHCSFVVKNAVLSQVIRSVGASQPLPELSAESVSLASLIRPPIA